MSNAGRDGGISLSMPGQHVDLSNRAAWREHIIHHSRFLRYPRAVPTKVIE